MTRPGVHMWSTVVTMAPHRPWPRAGLPVLGGLGVFAAAVLAALGVAGLPGWFQGCVAGWALFLAWCGTGL